MGTSSTSVVKGSVKSGKRGRGGLGTGKKLLAEALSIKVKNNSCLFQTKSPKRAGRRKRRIPGPESSQAEQRVPGTGGVEDMRSSGIMQSCWK